MNENSQSESRSRVEKNLKEFWNNHGAATVNHYKTLVKTWPEELEDHRMSFFEFVESMKKCKVLILTANSIEANLMVRYLSKESERALPTYGADGCMYRFGCIKGINVVHLQPIETASFVKNGAFHAVSKALKRCNPNLVVSLGVAFGTCPDRHSLGDVIVSKELCAYDSKNRMEETDYFVDPQTIHHIDTQLLSSWQNPLSCEVPPKSVLESTKQDFHWYCGTILSGGTLFSNAERKEELVEAAKRISPKIIGGEMEGFGVYSACEREKESIPCIVIKGICDWGALKNSWGRMKAVYFEKDTLLEDNNLVKDCIQALAMTNAFYTLSYLLQYDSNVFLLRNENDFKVKKVFHHGSMKFRKFVERENGTFLLILAAILFVYVLFFIQIVIYDGSLLQSRAGFILCSVLVTLISGLLWVRNASRAKYLCEPERNAFGFANIKLWNLNFEKCQCVFQNINMVALENMEIAWLSKAQYSPIRFYDDMKLPAMQKMFVTYSSCNTCCPNSIPSAEILKSPITPDTFQLSYELNGRRFYHVFREVKLKTSNQWEYREFIFRQIGNKYQELFVRHCTEIESNYEFAQ